MRYLIVCILFLSFCAVSCKKDKYTSAPQITYKNLDGNFVDATLPVGSYKYPAVNFEITDGEGDIDADSAKIYIKNLTYNISDSLNFPDLSKVSGKNFKALVAASVEKVTKKPNRPVGPLYTDTLFYEIYVKDFAKNKSNIIKTGDPVFFRYR